MTDETAGIPPASASGGPAPDGPHIGLETVTAEILPALMARLRASRLGELEVRSEGWRVRLRRDLSAPPRVGAPSASHGATIEADAAEGSVARSTAVGYFSPAPGLVVGATVQAGDTLGTIDMLGIAMEVTAPADGVVSSVLAEDGQAVEYGQALAEIDPLVLDLEPEAGAPDTDEDAS